MTHRRGVLHARDTGYLTYGVWWMLRLAAERVLAWGLRGMACTLPPRTEQRSALRVSWSPGASALRLCIGTEGLSLCRRIEAQLAPPDDSSAAAAPAAGSAWASAPPGYGAPPQQATQAAYGSYQNGGAQEYAPHGYAPPGGHTGGQYGLPYGESHAMPHGDPHSYGSGQQAAYPQQIGPHDWASDQNGYHAGSAAPELLPPEQYQQYQDGWQMEGRY